jgi:hypothetical protein
MASEKPTEAADRKPFLTTLPGILTAVAAIITALTGLLATLGLPGREPKPPAAASAPAAQPPAPGITTTGAGSPVITGAGGDVSVTVDQ